MKPILLTYDQWRHLGYGVIKGQKAREWDDDGVALFSHHQVKQVGRAERYYPVPARSNSYWQDDDDVPYPRENVSQSPKRDTEPKPVYFADGSGYYPASGPCGPLYFDKFGNT